MPGPRYTLIHGDYFILYPDLPRNGPQPDGDTISFLPDNDDLVRALPRFGGIAPDRKHLGCYSLRLEGIDALETHFGNQHQELGFARAGRDKMLDVVGFGQVEYWPDRPNNVRTAEHHPRRGPVLANGIESNGRVLGLIYPRERAFGVPDGERVFVDDDLRDASVNALLVRQGLAYAELYDTMPIELIRRMRELVTKAREDNAGFWPREDLRRITRLQLHGLAELSALIMFPKLYRRLVTYFTTGNPDLTAFDTWVRSDPRRDDRALLPTGELGHLHDLYNVSPDGITLRHLPEGLTFSPSSIRSSGFLLPGGSRLK